MAQPPDKGQQRLDHLLDGNSHQEADQELLEHERNRPAVLVKEIEERLNFLFCRIDFLAHRGKRTRHPRYALTNVVQTLLNIGQCAQRGARK